MKKLVVFFVTILISTSSWSDLIVFFDPVTSEVLKVSSDARLDPSEYQRNPNYVILTQESDMKAVHALRENLPDRYLKNQNGSILEMTASEKTQSDNRLLLSVRDQAKAVFMSSEHDGNVLRAIVLVLIDEINTLRSRDRDRAVDVENATSLADLKSRWASRNALDDRTTSQAKTAVKNKINSAQSD